MDPIVISCSFQRLSRIDGFVHFFLLLTVEVCHSLSSFAVNSITLALLLCLLFMGDFWRLDKIMFRVFNRAEDAFVLLDVYQY